MTALTRRAALATPAAMLATPALAQARPVVLEMPSYQLREGFGPWWRAAAEEFGRRHPSLRVNLIEVPFEPHHAQLTTRFIAKNPPDLCHISARFFYGFADQGLPACGRSSATGRSRIFAAIQGSVIGPSRSGSGCKTMRPRLQTQRGMICWLSV